MTNPQKVEDPGSYDDQLSAEVAAERQEFIKEQEERIAELDREIGQLATRIEHESEYVSQSERAEWKQELFELKLEKEDARARLQRAETASSAEWQAARSDAAVTVDRLEAGIDALSTRIARVFSAEPDTSSVREEPAQGSDVDSPGEERQPVRGEQEPEAQPDRHEPEEWEGDEREPQ